MNVVLLKENFVARPTNLIKIHSMSLSKDGLLRKEKAVCRHKEREKYKFEFEANKEIESGGKLD